MLAVSALVFIYSLGLVTDLYEAFYGTMRNLNNYHDTLVEGSWIFYDIQPFNSQLTGAAIVLILCSLLLMITNTHSRRKYYIANYVAIGITTVVNVAVSIWACINIAAFRTQFLTTVDFEALKKYAEEWKSYYTESTFWFDAGFVVFALVLVITALVIVNLIWKINMMKDEDRIIKEGLEG